MAELAQSRAFNDAATILSFEDTVRSRRSPRAFQDRPVPDELIREVLEDAQHTPSNCNTQPWNVHIVGGEKLKQLSVLLHRKNKTAF